MTSRRQIGVETVDLDELPGGEESGLLQGEVDRLVLGRRRSIDNLRFETATTSARSRQCDESDGQPA